MTSFYSYSDTVADLILLSLKFNDSEQCDFFLKEFGYSLFINVPESNKK